MLFVQNQASWSFWAKTATVSTLGTVHAGEGRADMGTKYVKGPVQSMYHIYQSNF